MSNKLLKKKIIDTSIILTAYINFLMLDVAEYQKITPSILNYVANIQEFIKIHDNTDTPKKVSQLLEELQIDKPIKFYKSSPRNDDKQYLNIINYVCQIVKNMQNNYLNEYKKILLKIEKLNCIGITPAYAEEISNEFAPLYALEEQYSKMLFLEETDDFKEILNLKSKIEKLETNVFKKGR